MPTSSVTAANQLMGTVRTAPPDRYRNDVPTDRQRGVDLSACKPAFDEWLQDGRLDMSVVFGVDGARRRGMMASLECVVTALKDQGWSSQRIDDRHYLLTRTANMGGKPVELRLRLISGRDNRNAKREFLDRLKDDEIVVFAGHTRLNDGLHLSSDPAGALHLWGDHLQQVQFGPQHQLLVLMSCKSQLFCDELRTRKGPENLKILASNRLLCLSDYADMIDRLLSSIEKMGSAQQLIDALDRGNMYTSEGAWDSFGFHVD